MSFEDVAVTSSEWGDVFNRVVADQFWIADRAGFVFVDEEVSRNRLQRLRQLYGDIRKNVDVLVCTDEACFRLCSPLLVKQERDAESLTLEKLSLDNRPRPGPWVKSPDDGQ